MAAAREPALVFLYERPNRYGLHALAGSLEAARLVDPPRLYFPRRAADLLEELPALLLRHAPVAVACSLFTAQAGRTAEFLARARAIGGRQLLLLGGGPHPSGDPAGALALGFDAVAVGEGEETIRDLVRRWLAGEALDGVPGVAVPDGSGGARLGGRRAPCDLERFPGFAAAHHKFGPVEITRGCPFGCPFCQTAGLFGRRVRHRSVDAVCRHVHVMVRNGIRDIRFISPNAFAYGSADGLRPEPARIGELLAEVSKLLLPGGRLFFGSFPSEVRPEFVTPETVALVRRHAANTDLVMGAQSGSPAQLAALGRGHGPGEIRAAVGVALAAGLVPIVDFIFGMPGETAEDRALTLGLAREIAARGAVIHAHSFTPLPGTPWAGAPARPLAPEVRRALSELAARGALHGDWARKEREALRGAG
jgi:B12-binding domain/radical SAM domain protein